MFKRTSDWTRNEGQNGWLAHRGLQRQPSLPLNLFQNHSSHRLLPQIHKEPLLGLRFVSYRNHLSLYRFKNRRGPSHLTLKYSLWDRPPPVLRLLGKGSGETDSQDIGLRCQFSHYPWLPGIPAHYTLSDPFEVIPPHILVLLSTESARLPNMLWE